MPKETYGVRIERQCVLEKINRLPVRVRGAAPQ